MGFKPKTWRSCCFVFFIISFLVMVFFSAGWVWLFGLGFVGWLVVVFFFLGGGVLLTNFIVSFSILWVLNKAPLLQLICRASVACISSIRILMWGYTCNSSVVVALSEQNSPRQPKVNLPEELTPKLMALLLWVKVLPSGATSRSWLCSLQESHLEITDKLLAPRFGGPIWALSVKSTSSHLPPPSLCSQVYFLLSRNLKTCN